MRLVDEAEAIGAHPFAGRKVPEFADSTIRERILGSYRIVYRVEDNRNLVIVSRFWHAARGIPVLAEEDDLNE